MNEFNPSSRYVRYSEENIFLNLPGWNEYRLYPDHVKALRAFFLDERDQELGRWRVPNMAGVLVYPRDCGVFDVVDETRADSYRFRTDDGDASFTVRQAVQAYTDTHPESKPWHDANPGEVWLLTLEGEEVAAIYGGEQHWTRGGGQIVYSPGTRIAEARRIWPEDSNDS